MSAPGEPELTGRLQRALEAFQRANTLLLTAHRKLEGLSPEEVERFVTVPIEIAMTGLPGMTDMRSLNKPGLSLITLVFTDESDLFRERQMISELLAELRAVGVTSGQEQAVIAANAGLLGLMVAALAMLGGVGLTYLWSLGSPVYYGIKIDWGVLPLALRTGVAAVFLIVAVAAVYPVIHARRLETVEVLRTS